MQERRIRFRQPRTPREYFSDKIPQILGSWKFVIGQLTFCTIWIIFNSILKKPFDPFPFSSLANMLQIEGALAASFILIASNRQSEIDSKIMKKDLVSSKHMEEELDELKKKLL